MSSWALLGSGEFEPWSEVADRWLLERVTGDGRVVIAPTASSREGEAVFEEWGRKGLEHFASIDVEAEVLPVRTRDDAERDELAARLEEASVVYFWEATRRTSPRCCATPRYAPRSCAVSPGAWGTPDAAPGSPA